MQHLVFNTGTGQARAEIQNNVMKLLISADYTVPTAYLAPVYPGLLGSTLPKIQTFRNLINGKITVTRYSQNGSKQLITNMSLTDLAEICANNEGFIFIKALSVDGTNTNLRVAFSIELSNVGAIHSDKQDFLVVELQQFTTWAGADTVQRSAQITLSSLGSYVRTQEHVKYEPLSINANAIMSFDVQDAYALAVPDALDKLFLHSVSGEILEINTNELETLACDLSDTVYNCDGITLPYYKWRVLPIQLASKLQIQCNSQCVCYMMSNRDYTKN